MWQAQVNKIKEYIKENEKEIIATWERFVNTYSGTMEPDKVNEFAGLCKTELENIGAKCKLVEEKDKASTLIAVLGEDRKEKSVLLSSHLDTVFGREDFQENPFHIKDGIAYGPGVIDDKGGIVIALYTMKALEHIGFDKRPVKLILSGDEELGRRLSKCEEMYLKEAEGCLCAFNLEAGQEDNRLCIGRKGKIECDITVSGVRAHAANCGEKGKNAIVEMSHKIIDLQKLNDEKRGIIINVGTIRGGTLSNVVPAACTAEVDIRYKSADDYESIKDSVLQICDKTYIDGTKTNAVFAQSFPPFETTIADFELYEKASDVSNRLGYGHVGGVTLNDGSDSAYINKAGVPVVCAFGAQGSKNHTKQEYAIVDSIFNRAVWLSSLILDL